MSDLGKTQSQWTRFLGRELGGAFLSPIRELIELKDKFTRERTQIVQLNLNGNITALSVAGVDYGVNTTVAGEWYARFTANGGNWDVDFYKATGAGGGNKVAHITNVADGATAALVADNSSGITGSVTLGAAVVAVADDLYRIDIIVDYPARLPRIFPGTESVEADARSRNAATVAYATAAARIQDAIDALEAGAAEWAVGAGVPTARGKEFNSTGVTTLSSDEPQVDQGSDGGNVTRLRTGLFVEVADNMADETTGGEQDVVRRVVAAGAGSFDGGNSGKGTLALHTPLEKTPVGEWRFRCIRGSDTGNLGREEFAGEFVATDGSGESFPIAGLMVEKDWSGPRGFGPVRLRRTYAKTGDGSNLNFAAVTTGIVTGERNGNSSDGIFYWMVEANGSNFDFSFYRTEARTRSVLVAKATNVAAGGLINTTSYNGSGVVIAWTAGALPVAGATGTLSCQPFLTLNSSGRPDSFKVTTSVTGTPGLYQQLMGRVFDAQLNSDTSGSESIPDGYVKAGTFTPRLLQLN